MIVSRFHISNFSISRAANSFMKAVSCVKTTRTVALLYFGAPQLQAYY